jgi:hypothetical protein
MLIVFLTTGTSPLIMVKFGDSARKLAVDRFRITLVGTSSLQPNFERPVTKYFDDAVAVVTLRRAKRK